MRFAGELVAEGLGDAGIDVRPATQVASVRRENGGHGPARIAPAEGGALTAGEVQFATGRAPRTTDVGRETVALTPGDWLTADDACRVTAVADRRLYAVGHLDGRAGMTHPGRGRPAGPPHYAPANTGRAPTP
ncbi:pyridine nucleotide-disulfide oxidoreductase, partial [Streptomyces flaveolus]